MKPLATRRRSFGRSLVVLGAAALAGCSPLVLLDAMVPRDDYALESAA